MTKPSRRPEVRAARYGTLNSMTMAADLTGLESLVDKLQENLDAGVRPAAQAAAQVLYDDVKKNVRGLGRVTGNLDRSIYQAFSADKSGKGRAVYHISWNAKTAPHAFLVENGYLQRYKYYQNSSGEVRIMVRPGMDGSKRPGRHASQAAKDAYYVTLATPIQIPAKAFVRRAMDKFSQAYAAAEMELLKQINGAGE